jgi:ubiquitin-conjugating enzyme E2 Z
MSNQAVLRLTKELRDIEAEPDSAYSISYDDSNITHAHSLIIGPQETPYAYGLFECEMNFGKQYPSEAPKMTSMTTANGTTRFNPNVYANGKICLSLLGTWRGTAPGESWTSANGVSSLLIAVQSLLHQNPYQNEPGFDTTPPTDPQSIAYNRKIAHETIRITLLDAVESYLATPPSSKIFCHCRETSPFQDLAKLHLLTNHELILQHMATEKANVAHGQPFTDTRFECPGNRMAGKFDYPLLEGRMTSLFARLEHEWKVDWVEQSKDWKDHATHYKLSSQFNQLSQFDGKVDRSLEDGNAFVWNLILWGQKLSHWEGGFFNVRMAFHRDFPEVKPRIQFQTPSGIPHPNISSHGYPCIAVMNPEKVSSWIQALFDLFDKEPNPYPTSWVNPEAAALCFSPGTDEERKKNKREYVRSARRAADRSSE